MGYEILRRAKLKFLSIEYLSRSLMVIQEKVALDYKISLIITSAGQQNFENRGMNKSKSPLKIIYSKPKHKSVCKSIEDKIRAQLAPIFKIPKSPQLRPQKNLRKKAVPIFVKSTRYSSPNSNQSSEKLSKHHSRQKLNMFKSKKNRKESRVKKKKRDIQLNKQYEKIRIMNSLNKTTPIEKQAEQEDGKTKEQWKASLLKRFVMSESVCKKCRLQQMATLESTLKSYIDNQRHNKSKSFLYFALKQGQQRNQQHSQLQGRARILTIDWMYLISASLLLNRETVHLAVHYLDSYFESCGDTKEYLHTIASACLYLSVKQQERDSQSALIETICLSQKMFIQKSTIIEMEQKIVKKLNFRLKSNTLAFWVDYFTLKWDEFSLSDRGIQLCCQIGMKTKILLRDPDGECYKLYRQVMQLADCCVLLGEHSKFQFAKLSLASMYLILRVQIQKSLRIRNSNKQNHQKYGTKLYQQSCENICNKLNQSVKHSSDHKLYDSDIRQMSSEQLFRMYHRQFMKKASPIFRDRFRVNQLFNTFLTQLCQFQITEIIPVIKHVSGLLDLQFSYNIDEKAMQESQSYEDFMRRMTYSVNMKDYALNKIY